MKLTQIIQDNPIGSGTLAAVFLLEEAYIGIARNLVQQSYNFIANSFTEFINNMNNAIYHQYFP